MRFSVSRSASVELTRASMMLNLLPKMRRNSAASETAWSQHTSQMCAQITQFMNVGKGYGQDQCQSQSQFWVGSDIGCA